MGILNDCEEDLISELSDADSVRLCKDLFQACIITSDMCNLFTSLDHSRVDPQLKVRYILRLVSVRVKDDVTAWEKLLVLLNTLGGISSTLMEKLKKPQPKIINEQAEVVSGIDGTSTSTASGDANVEEDIVLNNGDVGLLTELLVEVSHKWEEIAISLGLMEHDRDNFRRYNNKISLNKSIACWVSVDSSSTLKKLKHTLSSKLVGEGSIAQELEKEYEAKRCENSKNQDLSNTANHSRFRDTNFFLTISNMSYHTDVEDGKSTLLMVQASPRVSLSYQWKKDGQPLDNNSTYSGVHGDILVVSFARQGTEGEYTCCVSKLGKEVCSNKIILTVIYSLAKKHLLNLYSIKSEIPEDSWPPEVSGVYIDLALIRHDRPHMNNWDYSVCGDADDIIAGKEKVEYEEVFSKYRNRDFILINGRPGGGKTTLVHKVIKDWAKGELLTKAKFVFLIILQIFKNDRRDENLSDLLAQFYSNDEELKKLTSEIEKNDGDGVCFAMDGLDEYQPQNKDKSVIYKLLDKIYLPQAMIIVSSRPAAIMNVKREVVTKHIEVFGFSKQQILEYINNFPFSNASSLSDNTVPSKLKEYLISNHNVFDMCYLPVHAAMICFLFKYDKENISSVQTKIYELFTRLIIQRHLTRHNIEVELPTLKELDGMHKKYFDDICHLAFEMIINSKQVISQKELGFQFAQYGRHGDDEYSLGLITVYRTVQLTGLHPTLSFT